MGSLRVASSAPGRDPRFRTSLAPAIADLVTALERIHAERSIRASVDIAPGLAVAIDPEDLDEMVGNLLDNAWRYARSEVRIVARTAHKTVELLIEDDGPGLSDAAIRDALVPGR